MVMVVVEVEVQKTVMLVVLVRSALLGSWCVGEGGRGGGRWGEYLHRQVPHVRKDSLKSS